MFFEIRSKLPALLFFLISLASFGTVKAEPGEESFAGLFPGLSKAGKVAVCAQSGRRSLAGDITSKGFVSLRVKVERVQKSLKRRPSAKRHAKLRLLKLRLRRENKICRRSPNYGTGSLCGQALCTAADLNRDGRVGFLDLVRVAAAGKRRSSVNPACDLNQDGRIGRADFLVVLQCWGFLNCNQNSSETSSQLANSSASNSSASSENDGPEAIAVWAYPDGVSVPYRGHLNEVIAGSLAHIGVVAYHPSGIQRVEFNVTGTGLAAVLTQESINPETGEYEWVFELSPENLPQDGSYYITAKAYPNAGKSQVLPELLVQKDTAPHAVLHLSPVYGDDSSGDGTIAKPFATLSKGLASAASGDLLILHSGDYTWPSSRYHFTKYVRLMPAPGASPVVPLSQGKSMNWAFLKIEGLEFSITHPLGGGLQIYDGHHLWFKGCVFQGLPGGHIYYRRQNARGIWTLGPAHHIVVEDSEVRQFETGISLVGAGHSIVRRCNVQEVNGTAIHLQTGQVLVSKNSAFNIGQDYRNLAWSVSKNSSLFYDFGAGQELIVQLSKDTGQTFNEAARLTLSGLLSAPEIAAVLNNDAAFAVDFTASLSQAPYPLAGNVLITDKTNSEYHWFYLEGGAADALQFSDNTPALNGISAANPAKNGTSHFDYIANTSGDFVDVVYRNNKFYNSATLGLKFGLIGSTERIVKKNIAIINNLIVTRSAHVAFAESRFRDQTTIDNFLVEHNLLWNTGGAVRAVTSFPVLLNGVNWVLRNNIIGKMHPYDYSVEPYVWGIQDFNLQYEGPAVGPHTRVGDPLFAGGLPSGHEDWSALQLRPDSPALGAAHPASGIFYDIDWNLRDSEPDAGPFEYQP